MHISFRSISPSRVKIKLILNSLPTLPDDSECGKRESTPEDTHENIKFHMPIVFRFMSDSSTITDISATAAASSSLVVWISESMFTLHINTWGILMEILYEIRSSQCVYCAIPHHNSLSWGIMSRVSFYNFTHSAPGKKPMRRVGKFWGSYNYLIRI